MIKVGILGAGWATSNIWLPSLLGRDNCKVVGVVDPSPTARATINLSYPGLPLHAQDALYRDQSVDLVVIATPNHLHVEQAKAYLERGIHVMVEKPACFTHHEADTLSKLANKNGCGLWVSSASVERADIRQIKQLIDDNTLGPVRCIDVAWVRASGIPRSGSWFTRRASAIGGVGGDLGWHMLDVGLSLLDHPMTVAAVSTLTCDPPTETDTDAAWFAAKDTNNNVADTPIVDVDTQVFAAFTTTSGAHLRLNVAWTSHEPGDETRVTVYGKDATLRLSTTFGFSTNTKQPPSLSLLSSGQEQRLPLDDFPKLQPYQDYMSRVLTQIEHQTTPSPRSILAVADAIEKMYASPITRSRNV